MDVNGGLNADGNPAAYDFATRYPSNSAPTLALLLTGRITPTPAVLEMGDRTAIPPYDYNHMRVVANDMPPIVRASWLRGVSALPNTFAHESYIDELATEAGVDPIEYRLRYLKDQRAVDLINAVAERAGWNPRPVWQEKQGDIVRGRGFAYALYVHGPFPGRPAAWSAWIADVAVNKATGDRFRELPFTPERILRGLRGETPAAAQALPQPTTPSDKWQSPFVRRRGVVAMAAALCAAAVGIGAAVLPLRSIAPIARPDASVYSAATIARGRQLAALGDCAVCHTSANGALNAGGRAVETPFGTIYATNITPDVDTGIGAWSYPAFERAMREGIHRDGRHLYPAFPYTHFAKATDADLQALYAYLMAQAPVRSDIARNQLAFPFNLRPLMAGWNALFSQPDVFQSDPSKSEIWNRGAYLVEGLGHCSACHSPRNALGAETQNAYLAGGFSEGWEAPALSSLSQAPIPWSENELYVYLRTGESRFHGVAAGPMAPVVKELAVLPDQDIRAMAVYLASFSETTVDSRAELLLAARLETASAVTVASSAGARLYLGACAACHEPGGPPLFGSRPSLALNSNLHSTVPDNLIQVILHGIARPVSSDLGYMPAFKDSMSDDQVAELATYLRRQFAPDKPAWSDVHAVVGRVREQPLLRR